MGQYFTHVEEYYALGLQGDTLAKEEVSIIAEYHRKYSSCAGVALMAIELMKLITWLVRKKKVTFE